MADEYLNPYNAMNQSDTELFKKMTDDERIVAAVLHIACYIVALVIAMLLCIIFQGCSTPKIVEQHHYHKSATDTAAIKALVDGRMKSWHQQIDSSWTQRWQQYVNEQSTEEHEQERITETVTTFVDSLGREVRQEQRTTERDMTRQQQQREERLVQEWESRLQRALDERDSAWQEKLEAIAVPGAEGQHVQRRNPSAGR